MKTNVWDKVSEDRISTLDPQVQPHAIRFLMEAERQGIFLRITSGFRSWKDQDALYAIGRKAPGKIVTNAKAGYSAHNFGLAIDVVPMVDGQPVWDYNQWQKVAEIGRSCGFQWGGDWKGFKDKPHFEMLFGKSLADLRAIAMDPSLIHSNTSKS